MIADPDEQTSTVEGGWSAKAVIDELEASLPRIAVLPPVASPHCGARWVNEGDELGLRWVCLLDPGHIGKHASDPLPQPVTATPSEPLDPGPADLDAKPVRRRRPKVTPVVVTDDDTVSAN